MSEVVNELLQYLSGFTAPYAVVAIGVPGSGKTTAMSALAQQTGAVHISSDAIRAELTGDPADKSVDPTAYLTAHLRAQAALSDGRSVILDETHSAPERRQEAIRILKGAGASAIVGVLFEVPLDEAKARNLQRERVVPDEVIDRMYQSLRASPPALTEGFDAIFSTIK